MKAHGVIRGGSVVLKKVLKGEGLREGEKVEVIILPARRRSLAFGTFKLGVKEGHLKREKMYAKT